jgi:cyanophycinase
VSPSKVEEHKRRGYIVAVGGAEDKMGPAEILRRFVEVSGGKHARIVIIPTASRLPDTGKRYEKLFKGIGVEEARAISFADRADATRDEWLKMLDTASGVFFTGGNQLRISTILGGTPVAKAVRRMNARGVTVGGTSAGAAVLSEHMIASGEEGPTPKAGMTTLVPGFGLSNRVIIDQHFRQRDRLGRLLTALAYNPFAVGVGLDEDTAAFINPDRLIEVVGTGAITFVDVSALQHSSVATTDDGKPICLTNIRVHVLTQGATYDLETREAKAPAPAPLEED